MRASKKDIAPVSYINQKFFNAPCPDLLKYAFRIIPINRITREITQNMKVVPANEQMEAKAREVVEQLVGIEIKKETVELALTKLLSNFSYLYEWGKCRDKWVWVSVFLLKAMMQVLNSMNKAKHQGA